MAIALVTGTSTGIGLDTAITLARHGYTVWAGARNPKASHGLTRAVDEGLPITPIALDVDRDASVREAMSAIGDVDVLVNNAGIGSAAPLEHLPIEEARALFETNVFGALRMMQAVLPSMRARRSGVIVNVSSVMGRITLPCHGAYAATKHALGALSEALAIEAAPFGIRVVAIEPGVILTPIWGKRDIPLPDGHEYGHGLTRLGQIFASQMEGGTPSGVVAEAILAAVRNPDTPLHVPVGADAEVIVDGRTRLTADEWVSLQAEPDPVHYVTRSAEVFGCDLFAGPSLHARRQSPVT